MARFYGEVGYGKSVESTTDDGVWTEDIDEVCYFGDIIRNARNLNYSQSVNGELTVANSISIVADQRAIDDFLNIKYVRWGGVYWIVTTVEVQSPRLILNLGGVYNGPTA